MPRLIAALIRHAEYQQLPDTPSALQPFPLTEKGIEQARAAAEGIQLEAEKQGWEIHPILASSRLLRAWQTADTLADNLTIPPYQITEYEQLAERQVGSVANLSVKQIENLVQQDPRYQALPANWKSNSHFCLPFQGAESLLEAGQRVADFLQQKMQQLATESTTDQLQLFIGHGAAFRHAAYHLGLLKFEQIAQLSMHHCRPVYIELNADNSWTHIAGEWKVRASHSQYTD